MTLIGISNNNLAAYEKDLGAPAPMFRDYAWLGAPGFPASWNSLLATRPGFVSWKLRDAKGGTIPATDVYPVKKYDAQLTSIGQGMAARPARPGGEKDKVTVEHEADSKASALSGTPAQIDAAIAHSFQVIAGVPGFSEKAELWFCTVGWKIDDIVDYSDAIHLSQGIAIDQPYRQGTESATATMALTNADIAYLKTHYPNLKMGIGEWGAQAAPDRAAWITGIAQQLAAAPLDFALYWNGAAYAIDNDAASKAALVAAMKAAIIPPTITIPASDWAALKGIVGKYS